MSTLETADALGIELVEMPDWNCCGASSSPSMGHDLTLALQARNIVLAEEMGLDIVTICNECYNNLAHAVQIFSEDDKKRSEINELIKETGKKVKGKVKVRHLVELILEEIGIEELSKKVKIPLKGLKLAPYYGCLALRPKEISIDDSENPSAMSHIIEALGGKIVPFDKYAATCCGSSVLLTSEEVALRLSFEILQGAKEAGADAIVTMCPLCHMNLDFKQKRMQKMYETKLGVPIIYFTQILGIALGLDKKKLGMDKNITSTKKVMEKIEGLKL